MTVNKAQGQIIPNIGVYLPKQVLMHGQLYVALSRATTRSHIMILVVAAVEKDVKKGKKHIFTVIDIYTKNISYKEVTRLVVVIGAIREYTTR